ncbi:hypothetical protein [Leptothermofonsia sp. ETS-13]|uniref:hypothetical protein n=1 Tax=Leptothermofonsia sp. ETS-13 TaxID=3035696 RepID=UPI003BA153B3
MAISDCHAGKITIDYQPGHPHSFVASIYVGEAAGCCHGRSIVNPGVSSFAEFWLSRFFVVGGQVCMRQRRTVLHPRQS